MNDARSLLNYETLLKALAAAGVSKGHTLIVHTSLSQMGFVIGGEETVIRALLTLVGEEGTIMMPSQTWKNLDPSKGVHWLEPQEWWDDIRHHWPAYDKKVTPAIGMGVVARMFCTWPGVERSDHPARSFAAVGKHARYLTSHHDLSNIFGVGSPLHKLYELDGYILLLGVGYDKNTSLHLSEIQADFKSKAFTTEHSAMTVDGQRQWVAYETQDVDDADFLQLGQAYDEAVHMKKHLVGDATVRYIRQRSLVDFSKEWFEHHRE